MSNLPTLDPIFHQSMRTRLGALLNAGACSFTDLKRRLKATDGNLDAHLRKLGAAGYLHSRMVVTDRAQTIYSLSPSGRRAFAAYVLHLKAIVEHATIQKPGNKRPARAKGAMSRMRPLQRASRTGAAKRAAQPKRSRPLRFDAGKD